jgi:DNA repair protein RadD
VLTLRPYQQLAVDAVYQHLRERDDNPVVVIPTGGGKTPVMATICRDAAQTWNGRVLILAHVKELLQQSVDKLKQVCPELPVGVYSAGLKRRDTEHAVIVAGIQSVYKRACDLDAFDLVLVDECFVEGTLVSTPSGDVPIELVQPGMFVCHARGVDRVIATSARPVSELVTLEYSDGTAITCTPNHPIFTETGWRAAGFLEHGSLAIGVEGMRMLWHTVSAVDETSGRWESQGSEREALDEAALLLDLLLQDPQQLHSSPGSSRADQPDDESPRALTLHTRRQRQADRTAEATTQAIGRRMDRGAFGPSSGVPKSCATQESQDRRRSSRTDDRHRAGWAEPSVAPTPPTRLSEDRLPGAKRLVRVSHHKPAGGRIVFNLHVAGHPSYFANGTLVHNCHLIPADGEGMYRQFLSETRVLNPHVRVVGFTATPFRLDAGPICREDHFLNAVCYEVGIRQLIADGFLSSLISMAGIVKVDTNQLHVRAGEFVASEVEAAMDDAALVEAACAEIAETTRDRQSVLIFASGVQHGRHVCQVLAEKHGIECGFVCGETPDAERDQVLARFRHQEWIRQLQIDFGERAAQPLKYLCNVNVLTTGFDAPNVDCVVLLRPTLSPGLYYQMVGRGFRLHPGKANCLVLDYGGNVLRHGPVDRLNVVEKRGDGTGEAPAKECPSCRAVIAPAYSICPQCGHEFPPPERQKHESRATNAGVLSGQVTDCEYEVRDITYSVHTKKDADESAPKTLRVDYRLGLDYWVSEWICFEHTGWARRKAEQWWRARSPDPVPDTAQHAEDLANNGALAHTERVTVRAVAGEKFERIIGCQLGPKPEPSPLWAVPDLDEVPF